jgi:hypothetical protein
MAVRINIVSTTGDVHFGFFAEAIRRPHDSK